MSEAEAGAQEKVDAILARFAEPDSGIASMAAFDRLREELTDEFVSLRAVLEAVEVNGPDADGLLWLRFRAPDGNECAVSTRSGGIVGKALAGWSDMRRAALRARAPAPGERE